MIRIDSEGRDVTDLPGLWSEDDTEHVQPNLAAMDFTIDTANAFLTTDNPKVKSDLLWNAMFTWKESPQGFEYWYGVSGSIEKIMSKEVESTIRGFIVAFNREYA